LFVRPCAYDPAACARAFQLVDAEKIRKRIMLIGVQVGSGIAQRQDRIRDDDAKSVYEPRRRASLERPGASLVVFSGR